MNQKTIWVVLKGPVVKLPPVMSLIQVLLKESEYKIAFISIAGSQLSSPAGKFIEFINPIQISKNPLKKIWHYFSFRNFAIKVLKQNAQAFDIVWYASMDTAIALWGSSIFKHFTYILQLHELYDTHPYRLKMIAPIARRAKEIVVPEINRAGILQVWLGLQRRPIVIPNKPYQHPRHRFMEPTIKLTREILQKNKTNKLVILYQGHIGDDRNLLPLAEAMRDLHDYELWLMGQDHGHVRKLLKISPNIKYLGYVPAPYHLEITSHADIGFMSYDTTNLNNLYCAPNKVWEYAGFGIPFLSNETLSLREITNTWKIGLCCILSREEICIQIKAITKVKDTSRCMSFYYDHINIVELILNTINRNNTEDGE